MTQKSPASRRKRSSRPLRRVTSYTPGGIVITKWIRVRFYVVGAFISLCFLSVGYRAYGLQVEEESHFRDLAQRQHVRKVEVPAPRGNIYDRNGDELAVNAAVDSVFANPRAIVDVASASEKLSTALGVDIREIESRLASNRYFVWLRRHVTPAQAAAVVALDLPGVSLTSEPRRFYPGKGLAGHVLGFAGIDGKGLDGLELTMNEVLTGRHVEMATLRDASGKLMVDDPKALPHAGAAVTLTLDRTIQFAAERAIREAVAINHAKSAVAVVIDVSNGNVLALASYPEFDPNDPSGSRKKEARNRALTDTYEIGSVMKIFTVATALELGVIRPSTVIDTEKGRYRMGRKVFRDSFHDEELDIGGVVKRSSNVGAVKIGQRVGATALRAGFQQFGFGRKTDIELPGEQPGALHPAKRWGELGLATHSFGYGMTSTPLQITAAMAAIGNKGKYFEPRVIEEIVDENGVSLFRRKAKGHQVLSEKTSSQLLPMLESVFEGGKQHGTARRLFVPGYRVGGKTGTAHKLDPETRKYAEDLYLSSFSGLAPIDNPRIAVTVLIDEPHGEVHYGGEVAGPAWTRIIAETLPVLGIPADSALLEKQLAAKRKLDRRFAWREGIDYDKMERLRVKNSIPLDEGNPWGDEEEQDKQEAAELETELVIATNIEELTDHSANLKEGDLGVVRIPDFTGLGLAKSLELARQAGVDLELRGNGRGIDQDPPPGLAQGIQTVRVIFTPSDRAFAVR